ncbi:IS30 family transposase [Shouchella miscanthi]|uniref:IS30 family transposase n=1 Tax=Shouchella miscanthi TaxID=2598861 RepID=UPI00399D7517
MLHHSQVAFKQRILLIENLLHCFIRVIERFHLWKEPFESSTPPLPKGAFQTATVDRGKEFACYATLESTLDVAFYFADPYSSWQRGSNENGNDLLRELYPKGTDLAHVDPFELAKVLSLINNRPRKCLQWRTAHKVFEQELLHLN